MPPRGCPPTTHTVCNASSQERALRGRCRAPIPAPPAPGEQGQPAACPKDRQPLEAERSNQDAPDNDERSPPGEPPATLTAQNIQQGIQANGPAPGPRACTPVPTASGKRNLTACPKDGQREEGERLTWDASHDGTRQPSWRTPPATPKRAMSARESVRCRVGAGLPYPCHPRPKNEIRRPRLPPKGRAAGREWAPSPTRALPRPQDLPSGATFRHPNGMQ